MQTPGNTQQLVGNYSYNVTTTICCELQCVPEMELGIVNTFRCGGCYFVLQEHSSWMWRDRLPHGS